MTWALPETFYHLRQWTIDHGIDVKSIMSKRQAHQEASDGCVTNR